ncbi:MAG: hypothetical protein LBV18_00715 [Alistipes sp.]|jgi:hypothetical protein|nr:hypothetical protein [Alistipes sp.]
MIDCYVAGLVALAVVLFAAGMCLMIRGYRNYGFIPLVFAVPFIANGLLSFPLYFALKERYLKNGNAMESELKRARRLTVLGWAFLAAMIVIPLCGGVWFFVGAFDVISAGAEPDNVDFIRWARIAFWSMAAVCAAYMIALAIFGLSKKR